MVPGALGTERSPVRYTGLRNFVVVGPGFAEHAAGQHTSLLLEGLAFDA